MKKSNTKIYEKWKFMRYKCRNYLNSSYDSFGGKGIKVCKEWDESFDAFYEWAMANGYRDDLSIERIDKNGDYCPENCKFVLRKEIESKKRKNFIEILGIRKPIKDWTDLMGWNYPKYQMRFYRGKEVFNSDEIKEIEGKLNKNKED